MMKQRYKIIIDYLKNKKTWIKSPELSLILGITDRTLRSYVKDINSKCDSLIESNTRYGYRINFESLENYYQSDYDMKFEYYSVNDRALYILRELLFSRKSIRIDELQEKFNVTLKCIEGDITHTRNILYEYEDLEIIRLNNEIKLSGNELSKRLLYKNLLRREIKDDFIGIEKISILFDTIDIKRIVDDLNSVIQKYNYQFRDQIFPLFLLHLAIAIKRMEDGYYNEYSTKKNIDIGKNEILIAKEFLDKISLYTSVKPSELEYRSIANLLIAYKYRNINHVEYVNFDDRENVNFLVEKIIDEVSMNYNIDFSIDKEFVNGFAFHISGLVERLKLDLKVPNYFLEEIKSNYPLIFDMAAYVARVITKNLSLDEKINITESELAYIAIHLGASYERLSKNEKYRVGLITTGDVNLTKILKMKIDKNFGTRLTLEEIEIEVLKDSRIDKFDFIINLNERYRDMLETSVNHINLSTFFSDIDEQNLFQYLNSYEKKKEKLKFVLQVGDLIKEEFFYKNLDIKTYKEVIEYMCDRLEIEEFVDENFKQAVLKRENIASTSFSSSVAIPHPFSYISKKSNISVAILKEPIEWGNYKIKLVILLALSENDSEFMKVFFNWLSNTLFLPSEFAKLIGASNSTEFINVMIDGWGD